MDEQNEYSGLAVCADYGSTMVLHHTHTMSRSYNHCTCRTYKKDGALCTAHYIRECVLDDVVLKDLRRVTAMAREHTQEFATYIGSRQSAKIRKEMHGLERELTAMKKWSKEMDSIFKRIYKDSVLGRIIAEQFQTLSGSYTQEMEVLNKTIPQKETAIQGLQEQVSGTDIYLPGKTVHRHPGADAGAAAAVQPKGCGPRKGRELEQARSADGGDPLH